MFKKNIDSLSSIMEDFLLSPSRRSAHPNFIKISLHWKDIFHDVPAAQYAKPYRYQRIQNTPMPDPASHETSIHGTRSYRLIIAVEDNWDITYFKDQIIQKINDFCGFIAVDDIKAIKKPELFTNDQ